MSLDDLIARTQALVCKGRLRKYYRFRWARFYGGIATADCVGCCLRCLFCWSWDVVCRPADTGRFYSPEQVAEELTHTARRHHAQQMRISGNEPTLNREHLNEVLSRIPPQYHFILETNGILLGRDRDYCRELARFPNLHARVSLKGSSPAEFSRLTGMEAHGFTLQVRALENLLNEGVTCHAAIMSFSAPEERAPLVARLTSIDPRLAEIEQEELIPYPQVQERLRRAGLEAGAIK